MTKTVTNLTIPTILAKVEEILETYPHHPYQQAFANPDIRQELIAYVLTRIHNEYGAIEETEEWLIEADITREVFLGESDTDDIVHQGIHHILEQNQETVRQHIPEEEDPRSMPSHWFG